MTDEACTKLLMRYSFASCFALETQSCIVEPWRVDSEEQSRNPAAFPGLGLYLEEYFLQSPHCQGQYLRSTQRRCLAGSSNSLEGLEASSYIGGRIGLFSIVPVDYFLNFL